MIYDDKPIDSWFPRLSYSYMVGSKEEVLFDSIQMELRKACYQYLFSCFISTLLTSHSNCKVTLDTFFPLENQVGANDDEIKPRTSYWYTLFPILFLQRLFCSTIEIIFLGYR